MVKQYCILFFLLVNFTITSQSNELSGFTSVTVAYKIDKNWSTNLETQIRSIADFNKIDYYEIKGGLGYHFNSNNQSLVGLGRYASYSKNKLNREEFRVWLQYLNSNYISRLKIEQRLRAEKRFFHNPISNENSNSERFRYRLNLILPINNKKIQAKTFFVNSYDELFITTDSPTISRNRIFMGGGYQMNNSVGFALGYLFQREFSSNTINYNFIYCGINFMIDRSKKSNEEHITTPNAD